MTNVPLGILLVRDLTTRGGVSDHLKNLYKLVSGDLFRDGVMRGVLIIRVPALPLTPSEATVAASGRAGLIATGFLETSDIPPDEGSQAQTSVDETTMTQKTIAQISQSAVQFGSHVPSEDPKPSGRYDLTIARMDASAQAPVAGQRHPSQVSQSRRLPEFSGRWRLDRRFRRQRPAVLVH
jgi:hypothetical protein